MVVSQFWVVARALLRFSKWFLGSC